MEQERQRQTSKRPRLVLVPCPYQGHITPMLQLGTFLHNNGFSITVVHTRFNSPDPSHNPSFRFVCLEDSISKDKVLPVDLIAVIVDLNLQCRASFKEVMGKMVAGEEEEQEVSGEIAGVIHDEIMCFCEEVVHDMKLRSFVLRTTSTATSFARMALVRLNEEGYLPLKESLFQDPVPELHPLRFKDLPSSLTAGMTKYSAMVKNMYTIGTPTAIIWNTMEWLEKSALAEIKGNCKVPVYPIGPFHKLATASTSVLKEDTKCLAWLDQQAPESVIYVAIGSIASLSKGEVEEMAWGLANSRQPFLWVIQPGSVRGSVWIESLPKGFKEAVEGRGRIVKWAPQKQVLAHRAVGGFWSHCGWNSTLESLSEGVPLLCRPCFGDQKVNARYLSHQWRVGILLEDGLERREIERGIRRLMVEEDGWEMRERAEHFKEKIEAHVKEYQCSSSSYLKELLSLLRSF